MKRGGGMDDDLKWIIGAALTIAVFVGTTIRVMFVNLSAKIAKTHERIDDVKDNYVRRDDLDARLEPISQQLTEIRGDLRNHNDRVISALADLKKSDK